MELLSMHDLAQHLPGPTRGNNLLDVFITTQQSSPASIRVDDAGCISDHRLIVAALPPGRRSPTVRPILVSYRNIKHLDTAQFEDRLRSSALFTEPASSVDAFADQIESVVTEILDNLAPVQSRSRRPPKRVTRFLSADAVTAKRRRRKLEKRWKRKRNEADRIQYRAACRSANKLINSSRQEHYQSQLRESDPKSRWNLVKQLLHSTDPVAVSGCDDSAALCKSFASYFTDKILRLRQVVASRLPSICSPFIDPLHVGSTFQTLPTVTIDEVMSIINKTTPKSSPVDFIPTSIIKACSLVFAQIIARLANL